MANRFILYLQNLLSPWRHWLYSAAFIAGALALGFIIHRLLFAVLRHLARAASTPYDILVRYSKKPSRCLFPLLSLFLLLPFSQIKPQTTDILRQIVLLGIFASLAWLAIGIINALGDVLALKFKIDDQDNLHARRVQTQIIMLRRITNVLIIVIAVSLMLMTFPGIRQLGATLFASAGILGIIAGIAARPTLSNLIAGIQIALTEPIRLDDVVIVEGEWGRIEEITTTYVVVRIWDLRRLMLPLAYFIEKPFQNWTRVTADLIGSVYIYTDYTVPVEKLRQEVYRILTASPLWDGKVWSLQVTDTTERCLQLRALMSASNSSSAWDLRCHVREKMIAYLQAHYPQSLPKVRAEVESSGNSGQFTKETGT